MAGTIDKVFLLCYNIYINKKGEGQMNRIDGIMDGIYVKKELLADILDLLYELRGEWSWKKDDPRAGNAYEELDSAIRKVQELMANKK
jgi:hypothetical protein